MSKASSQPRLTVAWNPGLRIWEKEPEQDSFFELLEPFSATWPASGSMRSGRAWQRRESAPRTSGSVSSSSRGQLLKTPTAQLAVNGGSQHPEKRKAGGHGPTLADEVEHLLPTPMAGDAKGTRNATAGRKTHNPNINLGWTLSDVVFAGKLAAPVKLLPTPDTGLSPNGHGRRGGKPGNGRQSGASLDAIAKLLPTPMARLGDSTSRGADPARYKGPKSLNGRRSNLDDCIAAVETKAPWLGESSNPRSADGSTSPVVQLPGQLTIEDA